MNKLLPLLFLLSCTWVSCAQKNNIMQEKNQATPTGDTGNTDTAIFANGCFWCTEAIFQELKGVLSVASGYTGGHTENPSYQAVTTGTTGHAEALKVIYNPAVISYDELLEVFWKTHDPTTLNRQGNDVGTQYRSVVFYMNDTQKQLAEKYKKALDQSDAYPNPIVTTIEPAETFYVAENYHQNYFRLNGENPYCQYVIQPKLEKFRKAFKGKTVGRD